MKALPRNLCSWGELCTRQYTRSVARTVRYTSTAPSSRTEPAHRQWSNPLAKALAESITTTGPISIAQYMTMCLTSPDGGYYTRSHEGRDQFGKSGDFITSPEISQVFGELVALWFVAEWRAQGSKNHGIKIIELGSGRGTLMDDMLRTFSRFGTFNSSIESIHLVELSGPLREKQRKLLCGNAPFSTRDGIIESRSKYSNKHKIIWCDGLRDIPHSADETPFIIAHEFFDALPIHAFQAVQGNSQSTLPLSDQPTKENRQLVRNAWHEILVTPTSPYKTNPKAYAPSETPEFELVLSKAPTPHSLLVPTYSQRYTALLSQPGSTIEISPSALFTAAEIAIRIGGSSPDTPSLARRQPKRRPPVLKSAPSGGALIIDYGPSSTIPNSTLRGIRSHKLVSPFCSPGEVDLSASVDFGGLAEFAIDASEDVEVHGPASQGFWLRQMGGEKRVSMLVEALGGDAEGQKRIEGAWKRLVDTGPRGMGELYKVMGIVPVGRVKSRGGVVGFGGSGV